MRTIRLIVPGLTYHLISRFVEKRWFLHDDESRARYLTYFGRAMERSDWRCLSYALMSNHIHLGMVAGASPLETWTKQVHGAFAGWINQTLDRIGPVFARGPKDRAVHDDQVTALIAYQHNNPVRAGIVRRARDSDWTSHRAYLGEAERPSWLDVEYGLRLGSFDDAREFDRWVSTLPEDPSRVDVGGVRRSARRAQLEFATPTGDGVLPIVARPSVMVRPDPRMIVQVTAAILGVSSVDLVAKTRAEQIVRARRIAVHAGLACGVSGSDIGAQIGLSVSGVTRNKQRALDGWEQQVLETVVSLVRSQLNTVPRPR